jgi:hypothetical protein
MKKQNNTLIVLVFIFALFLLLTGAVSAQETVEGQVLDQVAREQNLPLERLVIGDLRQVTLPLTGASLTQAKVIDQATGAIYGLALDASGVPIDLQAARQAEEAAYRARYGRLEPALYDLLQTQAGADRVTVSIWLKMPNLTTMARPETKLEQPLLQDGNAPLEPAAADRGAIEAGRDKTPEEMAAQEAEQEAALAQQTEVQMAARAAQDAVDQQAIGALAQQVAAVESPLVAWLSAQGYEPVYVSTTAPIIYVELPKDAILDLNQREDVDTVYGPGQYHDTLDSARPTQKGDVVNSWGYNGSGVKVAILEDNRIEFTNPYIPDGVTRDMGGTTDQHSAATAGIVASTHGTYHGVASGVSLYSANAPGYTEANITAAMDWAVDQGVDVINNSWGGNADNTDLNLFDRHLDHIVRNGWRTVTVAAGNENDGCDSGTGRVTSPARAYNVMSVGNYYDVNTLTWTDDYMDGCSSFVNPSTGIEKPELSAVGTDINSTTDASPWVANVGSGTSYSSPMVAGEAALVMQWESAMRRWPEPVKAMLMATALHNIEGEARLSSYDGAGGVDMRAAFHTANLYNRSGVEAHAADFPLHTYFYAYAGEMVRAVIAWDSNPAGDYSTDPLNADLDLCVYDPSATSVGCSASFNNSYEILQFNATTTGTYEIRTTAFRFDGTSEWVGVGWWTGHRVLTGYTPQVFGTPPISYDYYRVTPALGYWHAAGIRSPSSNDYDIYLYDNSAFGNPSTHTWLEDSTTSNPVDFVVIDNNHAPLASYYPEVRLYSGSGGNYPIEWAGEPAVAVYDGTYGPYTMVANDVVRIWDNYASSGVRKYFAIRPIAGDADLGMALYASDSANSATWYQGRSTFVVSVDFNGAGASETMDYQPAVSDWMGLVAFNNGLSATTTFYLYADTTAPTGSVSINSGASYSNSTSVTLNLSGADGQTGVYQMRFSNNGSTWSSWEAYAATESWTLTSSDGTKTVYAQFMNNAEMASGTVSDTIILDTVQPTGTLVVNGGATYTTNANVTLALSSTDDRSGVVDMSLGNGGGSWGPWEPYVTSKAWTLISGDGNKSVWAIYRDAAGNISNQAGDYITLDTIAPNGTISINGGDTYATSTTVNLTLSATDATSGVYQMHFSNNGSTFTAWEAYGTSKTWTLTSGDGAKTVYVQYRDNAGNVTGSFSDSITLDATPPAGTININAGAIYANTTSATLFLSASDALSGIWQMCFSNDGSTWSPWEAYATTKAWSLPSGDGSKTVYVRYRDQVLNSSGNFSDTIILDTTAPASSASSPTYTINMAFNVAWTGSDATSGIVSYDVQYRAGAGGAWTNWLSGVTTTSVLFGPATPVAVTRGETYYFRVRARDAAGNLEAYPGGNGDTSTTVDFPIFLPAVVK